MPVCKEYYEISGGLTIGDILLQISVDGYSGGSGIGIRLLKRCARV